MSAGQPADAIDSDAFDKEEGVEVKGEEEEKEEEEEDDDEDEEEEDESGWKKFSFGADDNVQSDASMEYASAKLPSTWMVLMRRFIALAFNPRLLFWEG